MADLNKTTEEGFSPLQLAIETENEEICKFLIEECSLNLNQLTNIGTSLHLACLKKNKKIVKLLLKNRGHAIILQAN